jgi:hypothetical protein
MFRHARHLLRKPSSLIAVAVAMLFVAGPALSAQASETYFPYNYFSLQCLDAHVNGAVFTETGVCGIAEQEQWTFTVVGKASNGWDIDTIKNVFSHQCLDNHVNGDVFTDACDGYQQQEWSLDPVISGDVYILVNNFSEECLDNHVNGDVFTDGCDGYQQQEWDF